MKRLAGTWTLDARKAGGPLIDIEFDAPLIKEIKDARRPVSPSFSPNTAPAVPRSASRPRAPADCPAN
jgi:hypothetical protein